MNLGTSIFLSSVVLAIAAIFIATKDRWNWKKIILWPLTIVILIAIVVYAYNTIEPRPKKETSFWEVPLGAREADVKFLKGEPIKKDGDTWSYITYDSGGSQWEYMYGVQFKDGKVYLIYYTVSPNYRYGGPGIQGINIHYSWTKISEKYGEPSRVSTSEDELSRVYSFNKYGIAFEMKAGGVVGYGVFDTTVVPEGVGFASQKSGSKNPVRESR
jgi:hypothetical protein